MKLNYDCVRDLLLYLEENLTYDNPININNLTLKDYSNLDLVYTADKLNEADFISCIRSKYIDKAGPVLIAKSITYNRHQFLDTVRDEKVYTETKSALSSFKSVSIEIFTETASKVLTSLISKQLGLPN